MERRYKESATQQGREGVERFLNVQPCPQCKGARLKPESLAVLVGGESIHEISNRSIDTLREAVNRAKLADRERLNALRRLARYHGERK